MSTTPSGQAPMRDLSLDDHETLTDHSPAPSALGEKHQDEDATLAEGAIGSKAGVATSDRADGRILLKEVECYEKLGFCYPKYKKWIILSVIFAIQVSMNFNTSLYGNAVPLLAEEFSISAQKARVGQAVFLIAYAFGSELWAPWSEEYGRWPVLQLSLFFVNVWQIPCALAPNFTTIAMFRTLGGLSSAGGSVTLGMVGDMWEPNDQGYAVAFIVLSSVGGSVVGPVVGGFVETYLSWHWNFWLQLIFGVAVQAVHFFFVPETRSTVLVDREAKRLRKEGNIHIYGPGEIDPKKLTIKEILTIWARPFIMFVTEPIVLWLSLLSGFADSLIFTFLEAYGPVYTQYGFSTIEVGLAFIPLLVGYFISYLSFLPTVHRHNKIRKTDPDALTPEARLWWLLWTVPLLPIGLYGFAWTSTGLPIPWIVPMTFSALIAVANLAIYMATIDYMVAAYGPYAASATGGNAFARDFLAGVAAMYGTPFYTNIGNKYRLVWPSLILAILATAFVIPVYLVYYRGPTMRARSKFALSLATERKDRGGYATEKGEKERAKITYRENA